MAEDNANPMNLDLNLGPIDNSSIIEEPSPGSSADFAVDLEAWLDDPIQSVREVVRHRNQRWGSLWMPIPVPVETRNTAMELIGGNAFQTGEGSFGSEERATEVAKICEHGSGNEEDQSVENKKDSEKSNSKEGSFFDCNICLDLAKDPVVTCCGHLYCWPCLYRWLHHHSDAKECPVCKGEVTPKNVTPIYGRGNNNNITREPDADSTLKITPRPQARRIGNWRTAIPIPQEMLRRLGRNTFDLSRIQPRNSDGAPEMINNALLNRILTSRGLRRERNHVLSSSDVIELTENTHTPRIYEAGRESQRLSSQLLHRSTSHGAEIVAAERLVESYFHSNPVERNGVDDRDSLSSIAAVIHSESQTVDNAMEIDSRVSLSTSSSRRRNDGWRISDLDSGDSRSPRRRRLG